MISRVQLAVNENFLQYLWTNLMPQAMCKFDIDYLGIQMPSVHYSGRLLFNATHLQYSDIRQSGKTRQRCRLANSVSLKIIMQEGFPESPGLTTDWNSSRSGRAIHTRRQNGRRNKEQLIFQDHLFHLPFGKNAIHYVRIPLANVISGRFP
jgi:hypothetical protein